ncbi:MAG: hypothetical protein IJW72_07410 [Alphaproteobacteria bacterium]|nr:hypothetical protein [Alphaproteobacteria bacterium]
MKKYVWGTVLLLAMAGCTNSVEVKNEFEYKCGTQVVKTEVLDDNSMIVHINGVNHVLTRVAYPNGTRYENVVSQVSLTRADGDTYLTINGINYPICQEIIR